MPYTNKSINKENKSRTNEHNYTTKAHNTIHIEHLWHYLNTKRALKPLSISNVKLLTNTQTKPYKGHTTPHNVHTTNTTPII